MESSEISSCSTSVVPRYFSASWASLLPPANVDGTPFHTEPVEDLALGDEDATLDAECLSSPFPGETGGAVTFPAPPLFMKRHTHHFPACPVQHTCAAVQMWCNARGSESLTHRANRKPLPIDDASSHISHDVQNVINTHTNLNAHMRISRDNRSVHLTEGTN